ncbi:hypothetical protein V8E51_018340 [Hyaloscypha variabilis]
MSSDTWITAADTDSRRKAKSHTSREVKRRKAVLSGKIKEKQHGLRKKLLPASATSRPSLELAQLVKQTLVPDPVSPLGAGRVDPFAHYPVHFETNDLHELPQRRVCFLPLFQEIRRVSFEIARSDPGAFHTILAIASADRSILCDEEEQVQALAHNTYSIQVLNERMSNVKDATTDRTIATVALQILFLFLFESCDAVKTHADALENIVKLRGGLELFEASNPELTLLINLADSLPPAIALLGMRRFHKIDAAISDPATISPVALLAPSGLEALSHFDMYFDLTRICLSLQRATHAAFAGDFWTSSVAETKLKSQLRDLLALGRSKAAWGRRCEIMKCVCLAGLIYMRIVSKKEKNVVAAHRDLSHLLPETDAPWKRPLEHLIGELIGGDSGDCFESLAVIRRHLQDIYQDSLQESPKANVSDVKQDPHEVEMAGLTALFGFFSVAGS